MKIIKLNVGSGGLPLPGYVNIDVYVGEPNFGVDIVHDVTKLEEIYEGGTVDEIFAKDVLEHISWRKAPQVLQSWIDLLKPGGVVKIRVPGILYIVEEYTNHKDEPDARNIFNRMIHLTFGDQDFTENSHLGGFHDKYLVDDLEKAGMKVMPVWFDGGRDIRVTAIKGQLEPLVSLDHPDYQYKSTSREQLKELLK